MSSIDHGCPHVKCLLGTSRSSYKSYLIPIRCKRWTCRYCRQVNLKVLIDRIKRGHPKKFLTLTAKPLPGETPEQINERHRPAIRRLVEYLRRNHGELEYCCITELHKNGNPHWHLVVRANFIPQRTISRKWEELTGSFIVDVRAIRNARHAANYVAKYITKTTSAARPPWLTRVCQFSRNYAARIKWCKPIGYEWQLLQCSLSCAVERLENHQFIVEAFDSGFSIIPANPRFPDDPAELFDQPARAPPA